jgi:hypothetical protein
MRRTRTLPPTTMVSPSVTRVTVVSWPAGRAEVGLAGSCDDGAAVVGLAAVAGGTADGWALEDTEGSPGTADARYPGPAVVVLVAAPRASSVVRPVGAPVPGPQAMRAKASARSSTDRALVREGLGARPVIDPQDVGVVLAIDDRTGRLEVADPFGGLSSSVSVAIRHPTLFTASRRR